MSLPHDCFSNDSSPREFFHQNYMFRYITFVLNITAKYGLKKITLKEKYNQGVIFVVDKSKCDHCINMLMFLNKQLSSVPRKYLENDLEVYASELANKISEIYNCEIECYDI